LTTLIYLSNYRRYYSKILSGKYDPEVVPVMNLEHVQCYSVDPSVFVRRQQVNSQQVTLA